MKKHLPNPSIYGMYKAQTQGDTKNITPNNLLFLANGDGNPCGWIEPCYTSATNIKPEGYGASDKISTWNEVKLPGIFDENTTEDPFFNIPNDLNRNNPAFEGGRDNRDQFLFMTTSENYSAIFY